MALQANKPIETIKLRPSDRKRLIEALDQANATVPESMERRGLRVTYNADSVVITVHHPNGQLTTYAVVPRNLSTRGLGFLHGRFLYVGSVCDINLPMLDGKVTNIRGRVVNCRHLAGMTHEIRVIFSKPIDMRQYIRLTKEQEKRVRSEIGDMAPPTKDGEPVPVTYSGHVLIVDDFESDRHLLGHRLKKKGLRSSEAINEAEALAAFDSESVDLIMLDMCLGPENGCDVARKLRVSGCTVPIIAMSADETDQTQLAALEAGCDEFLAKPIKGDALEQVMARFMSTSDGLDDTGDEASGAGDEPIRSALADDEDMKPLLEEFVGKLGEQVEELKKACAQEDYESVQRVAQMVKGAGGGYGFELLTRLAQITLEKAKEQPARAGVVLKAVEELSAVAGRIVVD